MGQKLLEGKIAFAQAWNFGPTDEDSIPAVEVVRRSKSHWDAFDYTLRSEAPRVHEAGLLKLDCTKARARLAWQPVWDSTEAFQKTANWYKNFYTKKSIVTQKDLEEYIHAALNKGLCWTRG